MDKAFDAALRKRVKPLLLRARNGDWDHTVRAVACGRALDDLAGARTANRSPWAPDRCPGIAWCRFPPGP